MIHYCENPACSYYHNNLLELANPSPCPECGARLIKTRLYVREPIKKESKVIKIIKYIFNSFPNAV